MELRIYSAFSTEKRSIFILFLYRSVAISFVNMSGDRKSAGNDVPTTSGVSFGLNVFYGTGREEQEHEAIVPKDKDDDYDGDDFDTDSEFSDDDMDDTEWVPKDVIITRKTVRPRDKSEVSVPAIEGAKGESVSVGGKYAK